MNQARIQCTDFFLFTDDPSILVKYLSELKVYDLAFDLARSFKTNVSYPIALMIKDYQLLIAGVTKVEESKTGLSDLAKWDIQNLG